MTLDYTVLSKLINKKPTFAAFSPFKVRILSPCAVTESYNFCWSGVWLIEPLEGVAAKEDKLALLSFCGELCCFGCFFLFED